MTRQPATDAAIRSALTRPPKALAREQKATESESGERAGSGSANLQASLLLLDELEASLQAGQRALLSHDVTGLEQQTAEQVRLRGSLQALWSQAKLSSLPASDSKPFDRAWGAELGLAQMRVLQLGRVQAALLARAQRSLRMLSHLLAGPGAGYAHPFPACNQGAAWTPAGGGAAGRGQERPSWEKIRSENSGQEKEKRKEKTPRNAE